MLYRVIDERGRHALHSIVNDRGAAAAVVRESYPPDQRDRALAELGDGAVATDAADLFARRCGPPCRAAIGAKLGGVDRREEDGEELVVHTSRGEPIRLYRPGEGHWWGIVWNTEALDRERSRANQDLRRVEANAATYARRRRLEGREESPGPEDEAVDSADPNE